MKSFSYLANPALELNITKLYVIKCAKWFMLIMPIVVLFYQESGLSMQQIFFLKSIYSVSVVCMEIPSGYLADRWGRKNTLILGTILGCLGYTFYSFTSGFIFFMIAEIFLGIGQSFISGSDSALLYDTLCFQNKESEYLRYEGRITSIGNIAEAIAGVLGGLLATLSLRYPYYGQAFIAFLGVPAALTLVEPKLRSAKDENSIKSIWSVVLNCFVYDKGLRSTILFSSIIGNATLTMAWLLQAYFKEIDLPVSYYGVVWTLLNLLVGVVSMIAWRVEKRFLRRQIELMILFGISGCYCIIGFAPTIVAFIAIVLFYVIRGVATPILKDYINKRIESSVRATVLSVRNFFIRICFAIVGPFLGYYTDHFSLQGAFIVLGVIVITTGGASLFIHRRFS